MEVVHSHTGRPSKITTAQKDRITRLRVFMLLGLSGGGCFRAFAGLDDTLKFASSDTELILCAMLRVYYPGNGRLEIVVVDNLTYSQPYSISQSTYRQNF